MTAVSTSDAVSFDPYDYAFQEDPYPVYARLRERAPLFHNVEQDLWVLTRHADVLGAIRDEATYSHRMGVSIDASAWGPDAHRVMSFLALDGAPHQRLRSLVGRGFTPRRVRELEEGVQALTDRYLDEHLADGQELDAIAAFAGTIPMDVISRLMGVPEADRDEVRRHANLLVHREDGVWDVPPVSMSSAIWLLDYYRGLIGERRRQPGDDLVSALLLAEVEGDRLSDEEVIAFLFLMVVAGNETTTKLLGNALLHLGASDDLRGEVLATPEGAGLVEPWVEETLRYDSSTQLLARHLTADVTRGDVTAPAGAKLVIALGSANRDATVFTRPDDYDLHRSKDELGRTVSFGTGRHFCLGANLARLEARVVLGEWVRRVRDFEVDVDGAQRVHSVNVRGFARLPVTARLR